MGQIHHNFKSWWPENFIKRQTDQILTDLRISKGSRVFLIISMETVVGGIDQKLFLNLCLHTVQLSTSIRYEIQECHCFIAPPSHTSC